MITFRKYFAYHAKSTLLRLAALSVIVLVSRFAIVSVYEQYNTVSMRSDELFFILCIIIAALELAPFKRRKMPDLVFSLPIDRKAVAAAHYLNGLIHIFVLFAIHVIFSLFCFLPYSDSLEIGWLLPYFVFGFLLFASHLAICFMAFDSGDSVLDGVVLSLLCYSSMNYFLCDVIHGQAAYEVSSIDRYLTAHIYESIDMVYDRLIENRYDGYADSLGITLGFSGVHIAFCLIGAVAAVAFCQLFGRKRPEKVGRVSISGWGYILLIPIFVLTLTLEFGFNIVALVLVALLLALLFRKSVKSLPARSNG